MTREKNWKVFKNNFFNAEELSFLTSVENQFNGLAWLIWDLLVKLDGEKKMHR